MSRRQTRTKRLASAILGLTLAGAALTGCSASPAKETLRFTFSKREAITFMDDLVTRYNASQNKIHVELDTSGFDPISASFVRGNPPDLMLGNYNHEVARFVQRCTLIDLTNTKAASTIRTDLQPLMDQYGSCEGRISALPYSVMAASVIYNKEIFETQNLEIPQTWDELLTLCDQLKDADITPFYGTFKDDWTAGQGWFDYAAGGSINVIDFFNTIAEEGSDVGPDSDASFKKDFEEPMNQMTHLIENYTNKDAASRSYGDGNLAFANGEAAMYLQGPWAFSEIAKTAPSLELGTFPLPMTNNPNDLAVRANIDLAAMIPEESRHHEASLDFLDYLYQPENIEAYNASQLGFTPTKDAPNPDDPRLEGMLDYYENGRIYQGPSVLIPRTIPVMSYAQAMTMGANPSETLQTLDADWARLAFRAPASSTDQKDPEK